MNRPLKNLLLQRKGLTLIEVLIVMSLIGILSLPLIQMLLSGQKQFVIHQNILTEKSRCMVLQEKIKDEVLLAKSIRLVQEDEPLSLNSGETALYLIKKDSGYYAFIKETQVGENSNDQQVLLNEEYLKTNELTLNFKLMFGRQKALEVSIEAADYQIDTAIQLLNLKQSGDSLEGQKLIYTK